MKKKLFILILVVVIFAFMIFTFNSNKTLNSGSKFYNMPFQLRLNISLAVNRSEVVSKNEKPIEHGSYDDLSYEIYKIDDKARQFVFFDNDTQILRQTWNCERLFHLDDFKHIIASVSSNNDVIEVDRFTSLTHLNDTKAISEHLLEDGDSLVIEYTLRSGDWIVTNMELYKDIPLSFTKIIADYFKN